MAGHAPVIGVGRRQPAVASWRWVLGPARFSRRTKGGDPV